MKNNFLNLYKNNFNVYHYKHKVVLSNYVERILEVILDAKEPTVIVYPDGKELNMVLIQVLSLFKRYENYSLVDNDITHDLSSNDKIYYDGKLGVYKGKDLRENGLYIELEGWKSHIFRVEKA